ncbi:PGAP1-like protein [bacterium BMS3Abin03]|nr:PGAP1-like protein [bacterium BMS3Abin03]
MDKIIIGVHGLGNKPPKLLLEEWWRLSIAEGLRKIELPYTKFDFELAYWADSLHPKPLDPDETDKNSELFLNERYIPAFKNKKEDTKSLKEKAINYLKKQRDKILFSEIMHTNFPSFTDLIIKYFFHDLNIYLTRKCIEENKVDCLAKDVIREKLYNVLKKHRNKEILLIAHSMGSIVAYDVLIQHEKEIKIDSLLTIGSPLGVPFIFDKLRNNFSADPEDEKKLRTPDNILYEWINFADPEDKVAQHLTLDNLFKINSNNVSPSCDSIYNDYESEGLKNPHKSFGYLRACEVAEVIDKFLCRGKNKVLLWFTKKFNKLKDKLPKIK